VIVHMQNGITDNIGKLELSLRTQSLVNHMFESDGIHHRAIIRKGQEYDQSDEY